MNTTSTAPFLWQHADPQAKPYDAACRFARDCYPDRTIDTRSFYGAWAPDGWRGTFALTDGNRAYRLTSDRRGRWTVRLA